MKKRLNQVLFLVGAVCYVVLPIVFPLYASLFIAAGLLIIFAGVHWMGVDGVRDITYYKRPDIINGER